MGWNGGNLTQINQASREELCAIKPEIISSCCTLCVEAWNGIIGGLCMCPSGGLPDLSIRLGSFAHRKKKEMCRYTEVRVAE